MFAHYFAPFPRSIDNKEASQDYYTKQYMSPEGEKGKYRSVGGYLRDRPRPRGVRSERNWSEVDMEEEVRLAHRIGLDGFTFDILSSHGVMWDRLVMMLGIVDRLAWNFKVLLMPDMSAEFKEHPERLHDVIRRLSVYPAVYRTAAGGIVIAPFSAHRQSPEWWRTFLNRLRMEGIPVVFLPVFQDWRRYVDQYGGLSIGISDWGTRSPLGVLRDRGAAQVLHARHLIWMAPVSPQDVRPKSLMYWEARNSLNYRAMWEEAIRGNADWVHVITWNDYSEHTQVAPSSEIGRSFLDLTAFYISWFKQGSEPHITCDRLYYFYRAHSTATPSDHSKQPKPFRLMGKDQPSNDIELLAFLSRPGTLQIDIGGKSSVLNARAGMTSFRVPLRVGTPTFGLKRDGIVVLRGTGRWAIRDQIEYQDLIYRGGTVE